MIIRSVSVCCTLSYYIIAAYHSVIRCSAAVYNIFPIISNYELFADVFSFQHIFLFFFFLSYRNPTARFLSLSLFIRINERIRKISITVGDEKDPLASILSKILISNIVETRLHNYLTISNASTRRKLLFITI